MTVIVLAEALVRWQHAAGPFWPYVCAAPFLGTGEGGLLAEQAMSKARSGSQWRASARQIDLADRLFAAITTDDLPLSRARCEEARREGPRHSWGRGQGGGGFPAPMLPGSEASLSLILADLPAEPLLAVAPLLVARGWHVVPVVQRWIASPAVLPCRQLVERLMLGAWRMRRPADPRGVILIADGERTGRVGYPLVVPGRTFDNRYEYQICRFPSVRFLHAQGVRRVHWITTARPAGGPGTRGEPLTLGLPPVARDLHPYREALLQAGIDVEVTVWPSA